MLNFFGLPNDFVIWTAYLVLFLGHHAVGIESRVL